MTNGKKAKSTLNNMLKNKTWQQGDNMTYNGKYGNLKDFTISLNLIDKLLPLDRNLQQVITNQKVKPYLKYTLEKGTLDEAQETEILRSIVRAIFEVITDNPDWNMTIDLNCIYVIKREIAGIYEFMTCISKSGFQKPTYFFDNRIYAKAFASMVLAKLPVTFPGRMQFDIYDFNAHISLLGNAECGSPEWIAFPRKKYSDRDYLILDIPYPSLKICIADPETIVEAPDIQIEATPAIIKCITDMARVLHPSVQIQDTIDCDKNRLYILNYTDAEKCFVSENIHKGIPFFAFVQNNTIKFGCKSENCDDIQGNKQIYCVAKLPHANPNIFGLIYKEGRNGYLGLSKVVDYLYQDSIKVTGVGYYLYKNGIWVKYTEKQILLYVQTELVDLLDSFLNAHIDTWNQHCIIQPSLAKCCEKLLVRVRNGVKLKDILDGTTRLKDGTFESVKNTKVGYLAFTNGFLSLHSMRVRPFDKSDNFTMPFIGVIWDPNADYSKFVQFAKTITSGKDGEDTDTCDLLQKVFGYACFGDPKERKLLYLYGPHGSNGKSLLCDSIRLALGGYATTMSADIFVDLGPGTPTPGLSAIQGKRLGFLNEKLDKLKLDNAALKNLIGNDELTNRNPHEKEIKHFTPVIVPVIATNSLPNINIRDPATSNRLLAFPFDIHFTKNTVQTRNQEVSPTENDFSNEDRPIESDLLNEDSDFSVEQENLNQMQIQINEQEDSPTDGIEMELDKLEVDPLERPEDDSLRQAFRSPSGQQAILRWLVEGYQKYRKNPNFVETPRMKQLKEQIRNSYLE